MEEKEKLDCLKFIAQIHRSQFDERRRIEWRIVFTTLTFYVLIVAAKYGGDYTLPSGSGYKCMVRILLTGLLLIAAVFLGYVHLANNKNKSLAENAEDAMIDSLQNSFVPTGLGGLKKDKYPVSWRCFLIDLKGAWAWFWGVLTIALFALASAVLLTVG